jgi:spermidine synthase
VKPWVLLDTARIPGDGGEIRLHRRDTEFSIRLAGYELMNSRVHGSEEDLARLALRRMGDWPKPRVLIGGLGMGFTAAAALALLPEDGRIEVAELVPAVVQWNEKHLGHVAGHPLDDPRVSVVANDVARVIRDARGAYDAILLDVDNGPEGLSRKVNDRLYTTTGLANAAAALRGGGVLAVWSASPDKEFAERMRNTGFTVEETKVRPHRPRRGVRHTIWVASVG